MQVVLVDAPKFARPIVVIVVFVIVVCVGVSMLPLSIVEVVSTPRRHAEYVNMTYIQCSSEQHMTEQRTVIIPLPYASRSADIDGALLEKEVCARALDIEGLAVEKTL